MERGWVWEKKGDASGELQFNGMGGIGVNQTAKEQDRGMKRSRPRGGIFGDSKGGGKKGEIGVERGARRGQKVCWHRPHIHKEETEGRNVKGVTHLSSAPHTTVGGQFPRGCLERWLPTSEVWLAQPGALPWLPAAIVWPLGQCPLPLLPATFLLPPRLARSLWPLMNSHHAVLRYAMPTGLPAGWPLECQAASLPPPTHPPALQSLSLPGKLASKCPKSLLVRPCLHHCLPSTGANP